MNRSVFGFYSEPREPDEWCSRRLPTDVSVKRLGVDGLRSAHEARVFIPGGVQRDAEGDVVG